MTPMTKPPVAFSAAWRGQVSNLLLQGYGVEDIGLRLACSADAVRREVKFLRATGKIANWWGRK